MLTVSSMFSTSTSFDANMIRYEDSAGNVQTLALTNLTPRNAHLLPAPDEVGGWFELVKNPGSAWFPDSPTIRIDLTNTNGLRLGVQGFLAGTTNPNDDSLSVWLEWLDAPDTIASGTTLSLQVNVVATGDPDRPVIIGDLNSDGFVGVDDLNLVLASWNQSVTHGQFTEGDPSGDGFVGVDDLNIVLANWNNGTPPSVQALANIPEPGSLLLLLGLSGLALVRGDARQGACV